MRKRMLLFSLYMTVASGMHTVEFPTIPNLFYAKGFKVPCTDDEGLAIKEILIQDGSFSAALLLDNRARTDYLLKQPSKRLKRSINPLDAPLLFIAACRLANVPAADYVQTTFGIDINYSLCDRPTLDTLYSMTPLFAMLKWGLSMTCEQRVRQKDMLRYLFERHVDVNKSGFYSTDEDNVSGVKQTPLNIAIEKYEEMNSNFRSTQNFYAYPDPKQEQYLEIHRREHVQHYQDIIQLLFEHGADPTIKDLYEKKAEDYTADRTIKRMLQHYAQQQRNKLALQETSSSS